MNLQDRFRGAILGLACGDAVGTTLEFKRPGTFEAITDMVGGGPFKLEPGQWTDDTSMMLCLGSSLVLCEGFDAIDQMKRYTDWFENGYMSSNGKCFDVGNTIYNALQEFARTEAPYCGSTDAQTAGNGSLMRLAPIPLAYCNDSMKAMEAAKLSSRTTHGAVVAVDGCRLMTALVIGALQGVAKEDLLVGDFSLGDGAFESEPLCAEIEVIRKGSYKDSATEIVGSGYAGKSLEAAIWAFYSTTTFEEGCLKAANLGRDADTTAAIFGQLAGAFYGVNGIPERWRGLITMREEMEELADQLLELSYKLSY